MVGQRTVQTCQGRLSSRSKRAEVAAGATLPIVVRGTSDGGNNAVAVHILRTGAAALGTEVDSEMESPKAVVLKLARPFSSRLPLATWSGQVPVSHLPAWIANCHLLSGAPPYPLQGSSRARFARPFRSGLPRF
jgi:hypothetical protein